MLSVREKLLPRSGDLFRGGTISPHHNRSVNARPLVYIISLSIRYRKIVNESKKNPQMGKALTLPTSIRGHTRMLRTFRLSVGFRTEDGVYCLECYRSMKSLLRRKLLTVLLLFERTRLGTAIMKREEYLLDIFLGLLLLLNQIIAKRLAP
jgi:hypothetical protein